VARLGQPDLFTKRVRALPPAPEFALHCMVADMLRRFGTRGWQWTHIASGEYRTKPTAERLKRMGVMPGWPDFLLLSPSGYPHCLELKRAKLGRSSAAQLAFAGWCREHRVAYAVHDQFRDAIEQLKTWGALRVSISA
jgi:hypothetical protein